MWERTQRRRWVLDIGLFTLVKDLSVVVTYTYILHVFSVHRMS